MEKTIKHQDSKSSIVNVEIALDENVYYAMKNHAEIMNMPLALWLAVADNAMFTTAAERKTCIIGIPGAPNKPRIDGTQNVDYTRVPPGTRIQATQGKKATPEF